MLMKPFYRFEPTAGIFNWISLMAVVIDAIHKGLHLCRSTFYPTLSLYDNHCLMELVFSIVKN